MSRIEDDRDAARRAERLAQKKRQEELRAKDRSQSASVFSKLVQKSAEPRPADPPEAVGRSVVARLLAEQEQAEEALIEHAVELAAHGQAQEDPAQARRKSSQRAGELAEGAHQKGQLEQEWAQTMREGGAREAADSAAGRGRDQEAAAGRADRRKSDARTDREALEGRGRSAQTPGRRGGELRTDPDRDQRGGQDSQGGKGEGKPELSGGFRFNPALMAPVPIARPKENKGSERLRALATEIAQKIVERVRVGKNAAGKAEFQIDLRSDVLSGLSIKVSGSGGRISAVFSGSDREVLKLLGEHAEALKSALTARGLSLEELKIEERA